MCACRYTIIRRFRSFGFLVAPVYLEQQVIFRHFPPDATVCKHHIAKSRRVCTRVVRLLQMLMQCYVHLRFTQCKRARVYYNIVFAHLHTLCTGNVVIKLYPRRSGHQTSFNGSGGLSDVVLTRVHLSTRRTSV